MKAITKAELELFNKLNTSYEIINMPLNLNFPHKEILKEVEPLLDNFVTHRTNDNYNYNVHFGWKGLVLRGQHWFRTGDALMGDPDHHWTEVANMLDVTTEYFKSLPIDRKERIRFMLLEPGGRIAEHQDVKKPRLFSAINFCLTYPKGCTFHMNDKLVDWQPGDSRAMNLYFKHRCDNLSKERRLMMILHAKGLRYDNRFIRIVLNSYEDTKYSRRIDYANI